MYRLGVWTREAPGLVKPPNFKWEMYKCIQHSNKMGLTVRPIYIVRIII
jgi:hypothetical protein